MTTSYDPDQSRFRTDNASLASTPQQRSFQLRNHIDKLRAANPGMSYDEAWTTANASPELRGVVAAMKVPAETPGATSYQGTFAHKAASAKFAGLVKQAQHSRGIDYDAAFRATQAEEPELFAALGAYPTAAHAAVWQK